MFHEYIEHKHVRPKMFNVSPLELHITGGHKPVSVRAGFEQNKGMVELREASRLSI